MFSSQVENIDFHFSFIESFLSITNLQIVAKFNNFYKLPINAHHLLLTGTLSKVLIHFEGCCVDSKPRELVKNVCHRRRWLRRLAYT